MNTIAVFLPRVDGPPASQGAADVVSHLYEHVRDVSGDDYRYGIELRKYWMRGNTFVVVEHDVVVTGAQLAQLASCGHEWCALGYEYPGRPAPVYGLGATKFAAQLLRDTAGLGDEFVRLRWGQLDDCIARILRARGHVRHEHATIVPHLHRQPESAA